MGTTSTQTDGETVNEPQAVAAGEADIESMSAEAPGRDEFEASMRQAIIDDEIESGNLEELTEISEAKYTFTCVCTCKCTLSC